MSKIRQFLLGVLVGMMLGIPIAWAAQGLTLVSGNGTELGTTSNPVYVEVQ